MEGSVSPESNRLLGLLDARALQMLRPHLELVRFPAGAVLYEPGQVLKYAVFSVSGLLARVAMTRDGRCTEVTLCGADGMIGMSMLLGGRPFSSRAVVLCESLAYRVPAGAMLAAWRQSERFRWLMLRYVHVTMQEIVQIALCNRHHTIAQQLARWLLMAADRLGEPSMEITQSVISHMLGVRREGITEAAGRLEAQGLIRRHRGQIIIVNRVGLEAQCCECCAAIAGFFRQLVQEAGRRPLEASPET